LGLTESVLPEDGDKIQSPKRCVLNKTGRLIKIQKHNIYINYTDLDLLVVARFMVLARKSVAKNEVTHQNLRENRLSRTRSDLVLSEHKSEILSLCYPASLEMCVPVTKPTARPWKILIPLASYYA
jgi:hypothetical protein